MKTEKSTRITLILDEEEARWLLGVVQNPLRPCTEIEDSEEVEDEENARMRIRFWEALFDQVVRGRR